MKLYIDTSGAEVITIKLDSLVIETNAKREKAQKLLEVIEKALEDQNISLKDLTEIEVNTGPGSFTGLRVGVSVANSLSWSLGIPINGKKTQIVEPTY